jgi:hypothetical protein
VQAAARRRLEVAEATRLAAAEARDPLIIARVAAEVLLRKAEETGAAEDFVTASVAAKRVADAAAALGRVGASIAMARAQRLAEGKGVGGG